jgi:hypothetical protein
MVPTLRVVSGSSFASSSGRGPTVVYKPLCWHMDADGAYCNCREWEGWVKLRGLPDKSVGTAALDAVPHEE